MKTLVPPAPIGATSEEKPKREAVAPKVKSPFDAAFLRRVYRSMLIFGIPMTVLAAYWTRSAIGIGSFVAGMLLAALMLRVQEVSIRGALRPASEMQGFDAKLLMVLLLPVKFLLIGGLVYGANVLGLLEVAPFGLGFFAGQLVLLCQVVGWLIGRVLARK